MLLLCFDFLGVDQQFNDQDSIFKTVQNLGLNPRIVRRFFRAIRKGGKTEENLPWIKKIYPRYQFRQNSDKEFYHEIFILEIS
jgi:hypothetical protein